MSKDGIHYDKIHFFDKQIDKIDEKIQKHTSSHYNTLVNLHRKVDGHKEVFEHVKPKIEILEAKLQANNANVDNYIHQANQYIETVLKIKDNIALLMLFKKTHRAFEKLETCINNHFTTYQLDEIRLELLERAAVMIQKIQIYELMAKRLLQYEDQIIPFFEARKQNLFLLKDQLKGVVETVMLKAYSELVNQSTYELDSYGKKMGPKDIIQLCVKIYDILNEHRDFIEKVFIQCILNPEILNDIPTKEGDARSAKARIFAPLEKWLRSHVNIVISTVQKVNVEKFNIALNGIWIPLVEKLNHNPFKLFDLSMPITMKKNYSATMDFISYLEGLCNPQALEAFKNHPSYINFMKKWNLQSFFYLRMNDIVESLERKLNKNKVTMASVKSTCHYDEIASIFYSLKQCWDEESFIPTLSHSFLKLSLQIFHRSRIWVEAVLNVTQTKVFNTLSERDLFLLKTDFDKIRQWVYNPKSLAHLMGLMSEKSFDIIFATLQTSFHSMFSSVSKLTFDHAIKKIIEQCTAQIGPNVKSITNMYRFTQKEAPTMASEYATKILGPLLVILKDPEIHLNEEETKALSLEIVTKTVESFTQHAHQLVTSIQKTQAFLNRKNARKEQVQAASDTQKMLLQLRLDANELETQIQEQLQMSVHDFEGLSSLYNILDIQTQGE